MMHQMRQMRRRNKTDLSLLQKVPLMGVKASAYIKGVNIKEGGNAQPRASPDRPCSVPRRHGAGVGGGA